MRARFVRLEWENNARSIASVYLEPEQAYDFLAGQYADITIAHSKPDSRGQTRTMTFSSNPHSALLRFTTRLSADNTSSYKQVLRTLRPGATVEVTGSMGDMILPLDPIQPLVFVAGGIGVASYVSIIEWLSEQKEPRNITLLYAVRSARDIIFETQFSRYAEQFPLHILIYTPDTNLANRAGHTVINARLTAAEIMRYVHEETQIYLSGTEQMVEEIRTSLQKQYQVPQYRIAFDYFDGYTNQD